MPVVASESVHTSQNLIAKSDPGGGGFLGVYEWSKLRGVTNWFARWVNIRQAYEQAFDEIDPAGLILCVKKRVVRVVQITL